MDINVGSVRDIVAFAQRRIAAGALPVNAAIHARLVQQQPDPGHPRSKPYRLYEIAYYDFANVQRAEQYHAVAVHHTYGLRQHWRTGGVAAPQWRGNRLMFYDAAFDFAQRYVRTNPPRAVWSYSDSTDATIRKWVAVDEFNRYHKQWGESQALEMVDIAAYVAHMRSLNKGVMDGFTYDDDIVFTGFEPAPSGGDLVYTTWDQDAPASAVIYTARNGVKILASTYDYGDDDDADEDEDEAAERWREDQALHAELYGHEDDYEDDDTELGTASDPEVGRLDDLLADQDVRRTAYDALGRPRGTAEEISEAIDDYIRDGYMNGLYDED
jgi:hypothetical protein